MDLKQVNLLNPSQIAGINTVGSSLRNSNLQFAQSQLIQKQLQIVLGISQQSKQIHLENN